MRYGFPIEIVSDQGVNFINEVIEFILEKNSWSFIDVQPLTSKQTSWKHQQNTLQSTDQSCQKL